MTQDALLLHCETTSAIDWCYPTPILTKRLKALYPSFGGHDAHLKYVDQFDTRRSVVRAERMRRAIQMEREDASHGKDLTINLLQFWQREVLGIDDVPFRNGLAYAKGGLEVYGWEKNTKATFSEKLLQDSRDNAHSLSKAVRVYLDICFFHPFEDGNARSARLAFDFYITRGGFAPSDVQSLFSTPHVAGRKEDYLDFLRLVVLLCERRCA